MSTSVAPGSGAGTGATATIVNGDDGCGIVEITTGLSGLIPSSTIFTLTYGEPYTGTQQRITVLPANATAALATMSIISCLEGGSDTFDLIGTTTLLPPGATLRYSYTVMPA